MPIFPGRPVGVDLHAGGVRGRQPVAVRAGAVQPVRVVRSTPVQRPVRHRRKPVHARQQPLVLRRLAHAARCVHLPAPVCLIKQVVKVL